MATLTGFSNGQTGRFIKNAITGQYTYDSSLNIQRTTNKTSHINSSLNNRRPSVGLFDDLIMAEIEHINSLVSTPNYDGMNIPVPTINNMFNFVKSLPFEIQTYSTSASTNQITRHAPKNGKYLTYADLITRFSNTKQFIERCEGALAQEVTDKKYNNIKKPLYIKLVPSYYKRIDDYNVEELSDWHDIVTVGENALKTGSNCHNEKNKKLAVGIYAERQIENTWQILPSYYQVNFGIQTTAQVEKQDMKIKMQDIRNVYFTLDYLGETINYI